MCKNLDVKKKIGQQAHMNIRTYEYLWQKNKGGFHCRLLTNYLSFK